MASPNGRIEKGQPLETAISARAWNRAQDAADIVLGVKGGTSADPSASVRAPFVSIPCAPSSGDLPRGGIVSLGGTPLIAPTSTDEDAETVEFQNRPVVAGGVWSLYGGGWPGVATEPIQLGSIGSVAVSGLVTVKLDVKHTSHLFAKPKAGSVDEMKTSESDGFPIIWKQEGDGSGKWAIVLLGTQMQQGTRLGKIDSTWAKGAQATVTRYNGDGTQFQDNDEPETFEAWNRFATITTSEPRWVACSLIGTTWHLVAAEC